MKTVYSIFAFLTFFYSCANDNPISTKTDIDTFAYSAVKNSIAGDSTNKAIATRGTQSEINNDIFGLNRNTIIYESSLNQGKYVKSECVKLKY